MAKNIYKYSHAIRIQIIELYSRLNSVTDIAFMLGINRSTINYWIRKYNLKPVMDEMRAKNIKHAITKGLLEAATGGKSSETTREYVEEDENGKLIKVTEKIRIDKPDSKAAMILARKYESTFSDLKESEADSNTKLLLGIVNTNTMSKRELQDTASSSPLGRIIDAEFREVESSTSPPQEDLE